MNQQQYRSELVDAVKHCSEYGLVVAAKWASDLLLGLPPQSRQISPTALMFSPNVSQLEHDDEVLVARRHMEAHEYTRAIHALRTCPPTDSKALFLNIYCQFIASERKSLRDWHKLDNNRHQPPVPINNSLTELLDQVKGASDHWLLFLKALFLYRLSRREEAVESALLSISTFPWNWSTWSILENCIESKEELPPILEQIPLPQNHPMISIFKASTLSELHCPTLSEVTDCDLLLTEDYFPKSLWIMGLRARILYDLGQDCQPICEEQFKQILALDPYRIEDIDVYSNLLYRKEDKAGLASLAQRYLELDKNRPEVCCIIGNYFSSRNDQEKAVKYFRRATQLDGTYFHAWTLMGHEFNQMDNNHAAIESYRRAVDVNKRDHRAWFGLGQAYSSLRMFHYGLYYFQRASLLRQVDWRTWEGIGGCLDELGQKQEAIVSYNRILQIVGNDDGQGITGHSKLAKVYRSINDYPQAVLHSLKVEELCLSPEGAKTFQRNLEDQLARARVEIAEYHLLHASDVDLNLAVSYLEKARAGSQEDEVKTQVEELLKTARTRIRIGS
ncbi:hypothetical protein C8J56DRAFT_926766 [Mycena floridula]|nr:hypothetical protein C8J56DRAFT_926766 [Mycena floridula]